MSSGKDLGTRQARWIYIVTDLATTFIAFVLFNICRYYILLAGLEEFENETFTGFIFSRKIILEEIFVPLGMLGIYWLSGFYNKPFMKARLSIATNSLWSGAFNTALIFILFILNDAPAKKIYYLLLVLQWALLFVFLYAGRLIVNSYCIRRVRSNKRKNVLIIGNSQNSRDVAAQLQASKLEVPVHILGYVALEGEDNVEDGMRVWPMSGLMDVCREMKPDQVIIAMQRFSDVKVMHILDRLIVLDIPVKINPDTFSYVTPSIRQGDIMGLPFVDLTSPSMSEFQKNVKRTFDVVMSIVVMTVLSPLYLAIYLWVRLSSPGGAIYSQERIGLHQKPFRMYKFRSMYVDAEKTGPQLSHDGDSRITPAGRVMRKYRLDELPQFWNVLKGDMSFVGPRPEREYFIRHIMEKAPYYSLVFRTVPGITSWGMVKYGYAENIDQMVERLRYDLIYLNNMSILTDVKIMIYTIKTVVTGEGK